MINEKIDLSIATIKGVNVTRLKSLSIIVVVVDNKI